MKKITGCLFFIMFVSLISAQPVIGTLKSPQSIIDSLKKELALSKLDTNRVSILSTLSIQYLPSDHKLATKYALEGLALARMLKFRKGEADCLRRSGIVIFQEGNYPEALDIFQRSLAISENINYLFGIGAALGHIGNVYYEQGDYVQARSYYFRRLKITEMNHDSFERAMALGGIGRSYTQQNYLDSASRIYEQVYKIADSSKGLTLAPGLWTDLGDLETKKGNAEQAMTFFRKGITYAIADSSFLILSRTYLGIANLYNKQGNTDSTIAYGKLSLIAGQKTNYAKGIIAASELLSQVYEPVNEHEAFKYQKIAIAFKDSLFNSEKAIQVQNLFFVEKQRQQSLEAATVKYKNQLRSYILFSVLGVFLILAIILYRNNIHKQRANLLLQNQKEEINQQRNKAEKALEELKITQTQLIQSEKMASLGELTAGIAHEIQNPLNFVNNFSEVSIELIEEWKEELAKGNGQDAAAIADDVKQNLEKIIHHGKRADAIVKGMLMHSRSSTGQKELTDINALADEYLRLSYHGLRAKDKSFNASFKTDFDTTIDKINIVPQEIGRVLLNLFTNAFYSVTEKSKHHPENYEPTVSVSTKKVNDKIEIRIKDNGMGISQKVFDKIFQPFFTTKPTGQGTGLGLSLSYDIITKSHGGELKVETKEGEFAEFFIRLPFQ
ncbi:MAG TPA: ATP-binding protein [Chitinophagaceae bacterium]|nr:ATP-binding protein [Chitinophagaceae bacterium]